MMADMTENIVEVKQNGLLPAEIKTSPSGIRRQFLNPNLNHSLSLISGYDGENEHIAVVDASGALKVRSSGSAFLKYQVVNLTVDSTTPSAPNVTFSNPVNLVDLSISGSNVKVQFNDTTTESLGDTIQLPQGNVSINYITDGLAIWCAVSGSASTVQVVGWW